MPGTGKTPKGVARNPKRCGSRLKGGRYCKLQAGHNTDHPGIGPCYRHGGQAHHTLKDVGVELAAKGIMDPGTSAADMVEIEPHNGLLIAVRSAAGEFFHWQTQVANNPENLKLVKEMREARMQMARLSKMSLDAGLAERQVALQERMADIMARFAMNFLRELELTPSQEAIVPHVLERAMLQLETGDEYDHTPRPKQALINFKKADVVHEAA